MYAIFINHSRHPIRYLGVYSLAHEMRKAGYTVKVLDYFFYNDISRMMMILRHYITDETRIVGFSGTWSEKAFYVGSGRGMSLGYKKSKKSQPSMLYMGDDFPVESEFIRYIIRNIKLFNENIQIVYGGTSLSFSGDYGVDWLVTGEGEGALLALAGHISENRAIEYETYGSIKIIRGENYPFVEFHKSFPVYDDDDFIIRGEFLPLELARGCIYNCSFCTFPPQNKDRIRFKDKTMLYDWLIKNNELYSTPGYVIIDEVLNESMEKLNHFYPVFTGLPFPLEIISYGRLDSISRNPEMAGMLLDMGLKKIWFGVETLHDEAGRRVGKALGKEKTLKILEYLKNVWGDSVEIAVSMIIGLPGENSSHFKESVLMLNESGLVDRIYISVLSIYQNYDLTESGIKRQSIWDDPKNNYTEYDKNELNTMLNKGYFYGNKDILNQVTKRNRIWKNNDLDYFEAFAVKRELDKKVFTDNQLYRTDFFYPMSRNVGFSVEELESRDDVLTDPREYDSKTENYWNSYLDKLYYTSLYD